MVKLKIPGKSFFETRIPNFYYSYLPVAAVGTQQVRYHEKCEKYKQRIFNFTVGILVPSEVGKQNFTTVIPKFSCAFSFRQEFSNSIFSISFQLITYQVFVFFNCHSQLHVAYWRDSSFIPRFIEIFEFSKLFQIILFRVKRTFSGSILVRRHARSKTVPNFETKQSESRHCHQYRLSTKSVGHILNILM